METYLLSPSILDESFLWFLDVKPIRALVIHMAKTSLRHYQMFHNSIQRKLSFTGLEVLTFHAFRFNTFEAEIKG